MTQEGTNNPKQIGFVSRYLPLVVWLVFISYASSDSFNAGNTSRIIGPLILWLFPNTSQESLTVIHVITRKAAHFTEYAILGFLAARAFRNSPPPAIRQWWFPIALSLIVVYALLDEYHQSFEPTRTASVYDSLIDMAGGLTALMIVKLKLIRTFTDKISRAKAQKRKALPRF